MNLVADDLRTDIRLDLEHAQRQLVLARGAQQVKDSPSARYRVAACHDRIDDLLDLWNAGRPASGEPVAR
jgi:hypothetical protein